MADLTPEQRATLRRLAENATDYPAARGLDGWGWEMARTADNPLDDQVRLYFDPPQVRYVAAVPPDVVLALLDRLEAAEARVRELEAGFTLVERFVGYDDPEFGEAVAIRETLGDAMHEAGNATPFAVYRLAVPGAVAGEPGGEQQ